jgi:hypothetical protein
MAARDTIEQLKAHIERLRRDSLDVVTNASRIVFEGVQKLAEQELKALNDYYKSAVSSAKAASGPSDLASQQLDLLQDTVQKVISAARESLSIISDTRAELMRLVGSGAPALDGKALSKVTAPAQKAIEDVKKAAAKAQATAAKTAADVKKTLEKELASAEKKGKAAVKQTETKARDAAKVVKHKIGSVLDIAAPAVVTKKAVTAKPSPDSRAARAASKKPVKKVPVAPAPTRKR